MIDVKDTLNQLLQYYQATRGVGHTLAALGKPTPDRPLFLSHVYKNNIIEYGKVPISFTNLKETLRGQRAPLIIDHFALTIIFEESLRKIEELERRVSELENQSAD